MGLDIRLYLERAENELILAKAVMRISNEINIKKDVLNIKESMTFYSSVISHLYYAIFYSAKAYLLSKDVRLPEQGQHQAVYYKFKKFAQEGIIDEELLKIYEEVRIKAEKLLEIFESEEEKRTEYTYMTIPQANKEPAEGSLNNARIFVSNMSEIINKRWGK